MMNKQMLESFDRMCKNNLPEKKKLVESVGKFIIMHKSGKFFWNDERAKFVKNIGDASIFKLSQEAEDALFNAKELYLDRYPEARNSDNIITTTYDDALSILDKLNHSTKGKNQGGDKKEEYQKVFDKFNISGAYPGKLEYEFDGKDGHYKTYGLKGTDNTGSRGWTDTVNFILRVTEPSGKPVFIGTAKELDSYLMNRLGESSSTVDLKESATNYEIAFIDVSGSNEAPSRIDFSEQLAKNAGAKHFLYFSDKIYKSRNDRHSGMTDYQAIIDYVKKNNITNYIIVTDDDIESFGENIPGAKIIRSDIEERNRLSKKPTTRKPETFDQRISRIKRQFELYKKLNVNANDFKPGVNTEGKEEVLKALPSNYAETFKNYDLYLTDDFNVIGYLVPDKKKLVVNGNLSIQDVVEVVKHELDHVMGIKENVSNKIVKSNYSTNKKLVENYTDIDSFQKLKNIVDSVPTITEEVAKDIFEEDTYIDTVYQDVVPRLETIFGCEIFIEPSIRGFSGGNFIWIDGQESDYMWDFVQEYIDILNLVKESDSEQEFSEALENYLSVHVNNAMEDIPEADNDYDEDEDLYESIRTRKQNSIKALKESYDEAQYEYQIFVNNEVLDDYFEDEDSAYAKAEELKQSKYYNGEEIYKIELWRAPLGELDGELYDMILDESYDNVKLNQLKESLGTSKYNKIQSLIKECLKEGMEVEITIPKKRK